MSESGLTISGAFCRVSFEEVNLNSPPQIKEFLLSEGWSPREYTDKGSPKMTVKNSYGETVPCPSLLEVDGPMGKLIARRGVLKHRGQTMFSITKKGELKGFLNIVRSDGRVEAGAITNSTNTGRMAHRGVVNVPKPKDKLWKSGIQLRELLIVPDDKVMMGCDADGLEARMEAHACKPYPGGEEYADELLNGDVHSNNSVAFGVMIPSDKEWYQSEGSEEADPVRFKEIKGQRDFAKSPKYALTYGCQPQKLATTLQCPLGKAKRIYEGFWRSNTALKAFKDRITAFWKSTGKKYIIGIDGRKIAIRSEHSIVNAYFQSTGSIVVKVAALFLDKWCRQRGLEAQQIILYHDEVEYELPLHEQEIVAELAEKAFKKAGEYLKIRVPTTGSPVFGRNWKDVH